MLQYPDEILKRLQQAELYILDAIADMCEREGIEWYLAGGTALGAMRHKGFIPWDDDIDIGMLRPHYEKFLKVAPQALGDEFEVLAPEWTPNYAPLFAKVVLKGTHFFGQEQLDAGLDMGIFVDVFPRDIVAANSKLARRQHNGSLFYVRASYLYHSENVVETSLPEGMLGKLYKASFPLVHRILHAVSDEKKLYFKFKDIVVLPDAEPSDQSDTFTSPGFDPLPISLFTPTSQMEFEGRSYPVPGDCEYYVSHIYGKDWNTLPPAEKRRNHAPLVLDFGDGVNVMKDYQED